MSSSNAVAEKEFFPTYFCGHYKVSNKKKMLEKEASTTKQ